MILACVLAAGAAEAKTVALWPLEKNNYRCAIDPRNDFTTQGAVATRDMTAVEQTIGWNLPPNADASQTHLFAPVSRWCVRPINNYGQLVCQTSAPLEAALNVTAGGDFTVEGFFRLDALAAEESDKPKILCMGVGGTSNPKGGWMVACYNRHTHADKTAADAVYFALEGNGWRLDFADLSDEATAALTSGWNHLALVFRYTGAANSHTSDWTLYLNGVSQGTVNRRFSEYSRGETAVFRIGRHQSAGDARTACGDYDYWRVSDTALDVSEFLNYDPEGKGGATVPETETAVTDKTVAYWKMNYADGKVDVRDYAGQAHLSSLWPANCGATPPTAMMLPWEESAFEGNPPNPTVTFPSGNHGAFLAPPTKLSYVAVTNNDLGATLDVTNAFTVEGWFKPLRRTGRDFHAQGWMFGNLANNNSRGWLFGTAVIDGRRYLRLYAINYSGTTRTHLHATAAASDYTFCDVTDWGEMWRHLALTYDPAGGDAGRGEWNLYMDGVLAGTVANVTAAAETTKPNKTFFIGGSLNGAFAGLYDAVRVSSGVLAPNQFLCYGGDDAAAATGVIATWPLNVTAGTGLGAANLEGGYNLFGRATDFPTDYRLLKGSEATPVTTIPNPDRSPAFDGGAAERAANAGSVAFCGGNDHDYAWIATGDANVIAALKSEDGWTLEGYVRYDETTSGKIGWSHWGTVFDFSNNLEHSGPHHLSVYNASGHSGRVLYMKQDPFGVYTEDVPTVTLKDKTWHHLAVCHAYWTDDSNADATKMSRLSFYLDGALVTNVDLVARATLASFTHLVFGSSINNAGGKGFPGMLNNWRLSRGVLEPSEFLNATPAATETVEAAAETLAYWPLDGADGDAVTGEATAGTSGYVFYRQSETGVAGSAAAAASFVPNADAAVPRANAGSALLTDGGWLRADYIGGKLDLDTAWTVEGWFLRGAGDAANRVLCGTYSDTTLSGWKLSIDDTGAAPVFRLKAVPAGCTPIADGVIPHTGGAAVDWTGWTHFALAFDPASGKGTWTLRVNGQPYGVLENTWRNLSLTADAAGFSLGASADAAAGSFLGHLDMWRASSGVRAADDLLYRAVAGTVLIFR